MRRWNTPSQDLLAIKETNTFNSVGSPEIVKKAISETVTLASFLIWEYCFIRMLKKKNLVLQHQLLFHGKVGPLFSFSEPDQWKMQILANDLNAPGFFCRNRGDCNVKQHCFVLEKIPCFSLNLNTIRLNQMCFGLKSNMKEGGGDVITIVTTHTNFVKILKESTVAKWHRSLCLRS